MAIDDLIRVDPSMDLDTQMQGIGSVSREGVVLFTEPATRLNRGIKGYLAKHEGGEAILTEQEAKYLYLILQNGFIARDELVEIMGLERLSVNSKVKSLIKKIPGIESFYIYQGEGGYYVGNMNGLRPAFSHSFDGWTFNIKTMYCLPPQAEGGFFLSMRELEIINILVKGDTKAKSIADFFYGNQSQESQDVLSRIIFKLNDKSPVPLVTDYYLEGERFYMLNTGKITASKMAGPEEFLQSFSQDKPLHTLIPSQFSYGGIDMIVENRSRGMVFYAFSGNKRAELTMTEARYVALLLSCGYVSKEEFSSALGVSISTLRGTIHDIRKKIGKEKIKTMGLYETQRGFYVGDIGDARPSFEETINGYSINWKTLQLKIDGKKPVTLSDKELALIGALKERGSMAVREISELLYSASDKNHHQMAAEVVLDLNRKAQHGIIGFDHAPLDFRRYRLNIPNDIVSRHGAEDMLARFNPDTDLESVIGSRILEVNGMRLSIEYSKSGSTYFLNSRTTLLEKEAQYMALFMSCGYLAAKDIFEIMFVEEDTAKKVIAGLQKKTKGKVKRYARGKTVLGYGILPPEKAWQDNYIGSGGYTLNTKTGVLSIEGRRNKKYLTAPETKIMSYLISGLENEIDIRLSELSEVVGLGLMETAAKIHSLNKYLYDESNGSIINHIKINHARCSQNDLYFLQILGASI